MPLNSAEVENIFSQRQRWATDSLATVQPDDDPQRAARALELSDSTGVPAPAILPNLDDFEHQHRTALSNDLVVANPHLQSYLNSDSMAPKISHDDIANLDVASQALEAYSKRQKPFGQEITNWLKSDTIAKGAAKGFGDQPLGSMFVRDGFKPSGDPTLDAWYRFSEATARAGTSIPEFGLRGVNAAVHGITEGAFGPEEGEHISELLLDPGLQATLHGLGPPGAIIESLHSALRLTSAYIKAGRGVPVGVHPTIDALKAQDAKEDASLLNDAVKAAGATATRERSPIYFSKFAEGPSADAKIAIDANAIARLYRDKIPEPNDNLLGWIPNLSDRLAATSGSGGYIEVPVKDYVSRIDPELHKELQDDILFRENGFTVNETKELPEGKDEKVASVVDAPHSVVRGGASLEPLFSVGDRKITLKKMQAQEKTGQQLAEEHGMSWTDMSGYERQRYEEEVSTGRASKFGLEQGFHDFDILDQNGQKIGALNLSEQKDGRQLYVDMIQAGGDKRMYDPNFLGPSLVRDLYRQIKEQFPKAFAADGFGLTGHRVSGAREKAGVEMTAAFPVVKRMLSPADHATFQELLSRIVNGDSTRQAEIRPGINTWLKPPEDWSGKEHEIAAAIQEEFGKIAPKSESRVVASISENRAGTSTQAIHIPDAGDPAKDLTIFSLMSKDPIGDVYHEGIHQLRRGFFTNAEWETLKSAALENNWHGKFGIEKFYKDAHPDIQIEESVAEAFRNWMADRKAEVPPQVHTVFEKLKAFFERMKSRIGELLGREFSWEEIFAKAAEGEIGSREQSRGMAGTELKRSVGEEQPLPEGMEEQVGLPFGDHRAIGIPKAMYDRYLRLIQKRHDADLKASFGQAVVDETRQQTKEWKDNRAAIREQVAGEIHDKSDVIVDRLMSERGGDLKIDPMSIREDLREALPKEYMRRVNSISADNLAAHFGYPSGDALVQSLAELAKDRKAKDLSHADYTRNLIDTETDRRMEAQYGWMEKNILEEAKDRALSENQFDILHEETVFLAQKAGVAPPLPKGALQAALRDGFNNTPIENISSDLWLKAAGKAGRKTEEALLKLDAQTAFKEKQVQFNALSQAKWAHEYEKERGKLDKLAKRLGKIVPGPGKETPIEPEYLNHAQDLLQRVGYKTRRSAENIRENIGRSQSTTVQQFVERKLNDTGGLMDIPLAEFLWDPSFAKPLDELTHQQFADFKNTISALATLGREEQKVYREGEAFDRKQIVSDMNTQVRSFGKKDIPHGYEPSLARQYMAGSTSVETLMNRFDRNDPKGLFHRFVVYPLARAANEQASLEREISVPYRELPKVDNLKKLVTSPFDQRLWKYSTFTRENVLGLLQNAGNRSNWKVAARGWGADPEELMKWLVENTTPEDWARAQQQGKTIFGKLIGMADAKYEHRYGSTIDKIPLEPIENDHGTFEGWYHPLVPDPLWHGKQTLRGGAYEDADFGHIATSNGYTRSRTGSIYPVDLSFNSTPKLIKQMVHDIAFRDAVLDVQKIFKDSSFNDTVTEYYGKEYADLLLPYLRNVAGRESVPSKMLSRINGASEYMRQNTIGTYIGFNPYTVMKHAPTAAVMSVSDVGPTRMARAYANLYGQSPELGKTWYDFAIDKSEELQRRERNWQETLAGTQKQIYGEATMRERMLQWGSWPVALSDKMSAVPLWIARFQKAMDEGSSFGESRDIADRSVRRQHGSTAVTNQPLLVQGGGPFHGWLTSVYGFFGTVMQRRIELVHQANDAWKLGREGEIRAAAAKMPQLFKDFMTYVVVPTAIEEYVTGLSTDNREGYGTHIAKAAIKGTAASFLYLRDLAYAATSGHDPSVGLATSVAADTEKSIRAAMKGRGAFNKEHAGKTVQDFLTTFGEFSGMAPKEFANIARFGIDYANKQAHPKEVSDYLRGLTRGTEKKRVEK